MAKAHATMIANIKISFIHRLSLLLSHMIYSSSTLNVVYPS